eukprot:scpid65201/ scgid16912/ N-sulphoglucosamine sulphohydrolase; Sulfoglucosamine sulfamidase; Sulphamidase
MGSVGWPRLYELVALTVVLMFWSDAVTPSLACKGQKNIVFIIIDDGGFESAAYNNTAIKTPHIDALGLRSTIFDHAYTTVSSCSPSRSAIMTGLPTHENGMYGLEHSTHHFHSFDQVQSLPLILSKHGYRTGLIGKKHVAPLSVYPYDYERSEQVLGPGNGLANLRNITLMKEYAQEFLGGCKNDSRPIFLYFGFGDPHRCGGKVGEFCELYGSGGEHGIIPDWTPVKYDPADVLVPYHVPDTPVARQDLANQYTSISRLDQGIGLMMKELDSAGLTDDTLIMMFSDNGIPFPGAKTNLYERGMGEPMFVHNPKLQQKGLHSKALVSSVDMVPTALDWANVHYPNYTIWSKKNVELQGRSLLPILEVVEPTEGFDAVFASHQMHEVTMYYPMRVIRNKSYRLIYNIAHRLEYPIAGDLYSSPTYQDILSRNASGQSLHWYKTIDQYFNRPKWELFNLNNDPMELTNLASDPAHADTLSTMQAQLKAWQVETNDPWLIKYTHE